MSEAYSRGLEAGNAKYWGDPYEENPYEEQEDFWNDFEEGFEEGYDNARSNDWPDSFWPCNDYDEDD